MPPVVPRPGMEGGLMGRRMPSFTFEKALVASAMIAGACSFGSLR